MGPKVGESLRQNAWWLMWPALPWCWGMVQRNGQQFGTIVEPKKWEEYKAADQGFKVNIVALVRGGGGSRIHHGNTCFVEADSAPFLGEMRG